MKEPLAQATVKKLLEAIMKQGKLAFSGHALDEMKKDDLTEVDVRNTLRGGVVKPGEPLAATYRYRVETSRMAAVVAFRSETHAVVVTAWRIQSRSRK